MDEIENAKRTLWYDFELIAHKANVSLDYDCRTEIEGIVDDIVDGIKEEVANGLD